MCRKQYRAWYPPHLKNKDIARWARRNGGNSKRGGSRKIEAQGLVGDWGKLWGIPEKEGHRQMPPREPRREMEGRVGNCRVTTVGMKSKQVRKYSFRKTCKLSSTRHKSVSKGLGRSHRRLLSSTYGSTLPSEAAAGNSGWRQESGREGRPPGCWDALSPNPHVSLEGHLLCSKSRSSWYKMDVVDTELASD